MNMVAFKFSHGETRMIPAEAFKTYERREKAVQRIMELYRIHGTNNIPLTPELIELSKVIRNAKRKIEYKGWYSHSI